MKHTYRDSVMESICDALGLRIMDLAEGDDLLDGGEQSQHGGRLANPVAKMSLANPCE